MLQAAIRMTCDFVHLSMSVHEYEKVCNGLISSLFLFSINSKIEFSELCDTITRILALQFQEVPTHAQLVSLK